MIHWKQIKDRKYAYSSKTLLMNTLNNCRVNPLPTVCFRSFNRISQSKSMHMMPRGHIETDTSTSRYFVTFSLEYPKGPCLIGSRSVVRSLIGLFAFRSNPVSKAYQHRSRNDGILEVTWSTGSLRERTVKDTAVGELTPDPFPQLANGTGPNRTRPQWKFTNV